MINQTIVPLYFNSKDRVDLSSSTSDYKVRIRKTIHNIESATVTHVGIPRSYDIINPTNNTFRVIFFNTGIESPITVQLPVIRNYNNLNLAADLTTLLNAHEVCVTFGIVWSITTATAAYSKFNITVQFPFGAYVPEWGVSFIHSELIDILCVGSGEPITYKFRAARASPTLVVPITRVSSFIDSRSINITSTILTTDMNTSYITSLGKSFNVSNNNNIALDVLRRLVDYTARIKRGTGTTSQLVYGASVALSANGDIMCASATRDNYSDGSVIMNRRIGNKWIRNGPKLLPEPTADSYRRFGESVVMSDDGNTVAATLPYDKRINPFNGYYTRAIYVYTRAGLDTWIFQQKIVKTDDDNVSGEVGEHIAISPSGNIIAAMSSAVPAVVRVYTRVGTVWYRTARLLLTQFILNGQEAPYSISISNSTMVISTSYHDGQRGAFITCTRNPDDSWSEGVMIENDAYIYNSGYYRFSSFGNAKIINGVCAVFGAVSSNEHDFNYGIRMYSGLNWTNRTDVAMPVGYSPMYAISYDRSAIAYFRDTGVQVLYGEAYASVQYINLAPMTNNVFTSLALNANGTVLSIGGSTNRFSSSSDAVIYTEGVVWIYEKVGSLWVLRDTNTISNEDGISGQGTTLKLSSDGNHAIIGWPTGNVSGRYEGGAWLYRRNGRDMVQVGSVLTSDGYSNGTALDIRDNRYAIVSIANYAWPPTESTCKVSVYQIDSDLIEHYTIRGTISSVALSDTFTVFGAPGHNGGKGGIYIYSGGLIEILTDDTSAVISYDNGMGVGISISKDGKTIVAIGGGSYNEEVYTEGYGYTYVRRVLHTVWIWVYTTEWQLVQRIDTLSGDLNGYQYVKFAVSMSDDGNVIAFNKPQATTGMASFTLSIYVRNNNTWYDTNTEPPNASTELGASISVSSDARYIAVGDPSINTIYIYKLDVLGEYVLHKLQTGTSRYGTACSISNINSYMMIAGTPTHGTSVSFENSTSQETVYVALNPRVYSIYDLADAIKNYMGQIGFDFDVVFNGSAIEITSNMADITFRVMDSGLLDFEGKEYSALQISNEVDFSINNNIIKQIDVPVDASGMIYYSDEGAPVAHRFAPGFELTPFTDIDVQLRDDRDGIIDLNGANWTMTVLLKIHY